MRKLIVAMLFLLGLPDLILAEKGASDRQLLIDAEQRANVFHPDADPFQLDDDFVVWVYAHRELPDPVADNRPGAGAFDP
jgi:hypothetical protein